MSACRIVFISRNSPTETARSHPGCVVLGGNNFPGALSKVLTAFLMVLIWAVQNPTSSTVPRLMTSVIGLRGPIPG